ncbi:MAG: hypothetical protein JJE04_01910 [Acidobacteriia bacterium]|nr:hypothetical protein [Terriglobia bacterium]
MKTSLVIDDSLFRAAKAEAERTGKTISETISAWASAGRRSLKEEKRKKKRVLPVLDLGQPRIDLTSRRDWLDLLDDRK